MRPVQFMTLKDGKLWFCTNSEKAMYAELKKSPYIELCASRLESDEIDSVWIRFSAEVVFDENQEVKKEIMQKSAIVHELYENNPNHPLFKVFYLKNIKGSMNNLGHVNSAPETVLQNPMNSFFKKASPADFSIGHRKVSFTQFCYAKLQRTGNRLCLSYYVLPSAVCLHFFKIIDKIAFNDYILITILV